MRVKLYKFCTTMRFTLQVGTGYVNLILRSEDAMDGRVRFFLKGFVREFLEEYGTMMWTGTELVDLIRFLDKKELPDDINIPAEGLLQRALGSSCPEEEYVIASFEISKTP